MNIVLRTVLFLAAALLAPAGSAMAQEEAPTKLPRLVIPEPVHDFGTVQQGERVEHRFQVSNQGDGPLQIKKLQPACGCTAAVIDTNELEPGQKTFIQTTFDTTGFQGDKAKTVRLYTNDPQQTSAVLTLKGTVKSDIRVEPSNVQFGNVVQGKQHKASVDIIVEPGSSVKLLEVESRSPDITATWQDTQGGKRVTVSLADRVPVGSVRGRVVVKTSSDKVPVINIPVLAFVEGDLQVNPPTVSFPLLDGPLKKEETRTVVITNRSERPVAVLPSISSDNENVSAELATLEEGKRYAVKVILKQQAAGAVRARLTIRTDHPKPEERELQLPVYAIISRGSE